MIYINNLDLTQATEHLEAHVWLTCFMLHIHILKESGHLSCSLSVTAWCPAPCQVLPPVGFLDKEAHYSALFFPYRIAHSGTQSFSFRINMHSSHNSQMKAASLQTHVLLKIAHMSNLKGFSHIIKVSNRASTQEVIQHITTRKIIRHHLHYPACSFQHSSPHPVY